MDGEAEMRIRKAKRKNKKRKTPAVSTITAGVATQWAPMGGEPWVIVRLAADAVPNGLSIQEGIRYEGIRRDGSSGWRSVLIDVQA